MKSLISFIFFTTLLGCTEEDIQSTTDKLVISRLEAGFINDCGENEPECVAAVKNQLHSCVIKSNMLDYIHKKGRENLGEYIKLVQECIVDIDGVPFYKKILAKNTTPLTDEEYKKYYEICLEKAKKGNSNYQYQLGTLYLTGNGIEKDTDKAYTWFEESADNGNTEAQKLIGAAYFTGRNRIINLDKAWHYYTLAAESGDPIAQTVIGSFNYSAFNYDEARIWWDKAAKQGHQEAIEKLKTLPKK